MNSTNDYSDLTDRQLEAEAKRLSAELTAVVAEVHRRGHEAALALSNIPQDEIVSDEEFTRGMAEHNMLHHFFSFGKRTGGA